MKMKEIMLMIHNCRIVIIPQFQNHDALIVPKLNKKQKQKKKKEEGKMSEIY